MDYKVNQYNKSTRLLESFVTYCNNNPELRFWQALCSWSGAKAIYYLAKGLPTQVDDLLMMRNDDGRDNIVMLDTFYWEEKNGSRFIKE